MTLTFLTLRHIIPYNSNKPNKKMKVMEDAPNSAKKLTRGKRGAAGIIIVYFSQCRRTHQLCQPCSQICATVRSVVFKSVRSVFRSVRTVRSIAFTSVLLINQISHSSSQNSEVSQISFIQISQLSCSQISQLSCSQISQIGCS